MAGARCQSESIAAKGSNIAGDGPGDDEDFGVVAAPETGEAIRVYHSAGRAGGDAVALGRLTAQMLLDAGAGPLLLAQDGAGH